MRPSDRRAVTAAEHRAPRAPGVGATIGSPSHHCRALNSTSKLVGSSSRVRSWGVRSIGLIVAGLARPAWDVGGLFEAVVAPTRATSVAEPATAVPDWAPEMRLESCSTAWRGAAGDAVGALAAERMLDDEQGQAGGAECAQLTDARVPGMTVVAMRPAGVPALASSMASWRLHDVHDPQSAEPAKTTSHSLAPVSAISSGARRRWRRWPCAGARWSSRRAARAAARRSRRSAGRSSTWCCRGSRSCGPSSRRGSGGTVTDSVATTPTGLRTRMRAMRVFLS